MKGFLGIAPEVGGVNITSTGFDFTSNKIVQTNSNPFLGGDYFSQFVGKTGTIEDITWQQISSINQGTVFNNFLTIEDGFSFSLTEVAEPVFTQSLFGTTGTISAKGFFTDLDTQETSQGLVTFSSDFVGKSVSQVQKLTTTKNNFVASWSLSGVSTDNNIVRDIPEPSVSVLVLILVLLMTMFIRHR